jgi:hypothetical protein
VNVLRTYQPSKKNKRLYELLDKLNECNEEINYHAIRKNSNRLDHIEKNAIEVEKFAREIQEAIKTMRRN